MAGVSMVTVCSMNICRSPAAEVLLARSSESIDLSMSVESAGCAEAMAVGAPRCELAQALVGVADPVGEARPLTLDLLERADLVLTADRGHVTRVIALKPEAREWTFTVLEAARLAMWVMGDDGVFEPARRKTRGLPARVPPDDLRSLVEPWPAGRGPVERFKWLVAEMHAARGLVGQGEHRFGHLRAASLQPDDLPDPHVLGTGLHAQVAEAMRGAVEEFLTAVGVALDPVYGEGTEVGEQDDD